MYELTGGGWYYYVPQKYKEGWLCPRCNIIINPETLICPTCQKSNNWSGTVTITTSGCQVIYYP